jgi:hypothetical protein
MQMVTWNAAHRGAAASEFLAELKPDVAVLPEWGRLPMTAPDTATSFVEFGKTGEIGLAVAAWGAWSVAAASLPPISGVVIGGVEVDGPVPFHLVAVWSCLSANPLVNPLREALDGWGDWLSGQPTVVAGDFNTGGWWQAIREGPKSHFPLVQQLETLGMHSAYHVARNVEQGMTEEVTHWHSGGGTFMIDHVFTPRNWPINEVAVGPEDPWRDRSDHAPIVVDVTPRPIAA